MFILFLFFILNRSKFSENKAETVSETIAALSSNQFLKYKAAEITEDINLQPRQLL